MPRLHPFRALHAHLSVLVGGPARLPGPAAHDQTGRAAGRVLRLIQQIMPVELHIERHACPDEAGAIEAVRALGHIGRLAVVWIAWQSRPARRVRVEAVGANVADLKEGQPVLVFGTGGGRYAEYNAVDPTLITLLPDSVDLDAATTIPNYLVAWAALHGVAHANRAKTVYVNGAAGGTGTAILDLCRSEGIQTIAGASSDEKCEFAASLGTIGTVNYSRETIAEKVLEITAGRGVDISFDQLGGDALTSTLSMMAPLGLIVLYNALLGAPSDDLFAGLREHRGHSVGVQCFSLHSYDGDLEERARIFDAIVERFASGELNPPIYDCIPLEDARHAHEMLDDRKILGKLILKP